MWPFRSHRLAHDQEIIDLVFKSRQRITDLEERIAAAEAAHERLRGRFYATKGQTPPDEPKPLTKAEILLQAGFRPGQPMKHS
jgi:hypothetical protein